eukprot:2862101-Pyramimonas_sp.AAC.1
MHPTRARAQLCPWAQLHGAVVAPRTGRRPPCSTLLRIIAAIGCAAVHVRPRAQGSPADRLAAQ